MREMFRRYNPATPPEERKGSPVCVASYPEPCGESAVGEGWGCLPFCERHWNEAEMAARDELSYAVGSELDVLIGAEKERPDRNAAVAAALSEAAAPAWGLEERDRYREAQASAFPVEGRDDLTDPDTLRFDYDRDGDDVPREWWEDARYLLLRFLRQAGEKGLPGLTLDLEGLREKATVQLLLADRDLARRYAAPRTAAREPKERPGG